MFDLIVTSQRKTGRRSVGPLVLSSAVHVLAIGVVALSVMFATDQLPTGPEKTVTFVSVPPPPPPPPAPAPTPAASRPAPTPRSKPRPAVVTTPSRPVPVEAPASLEPPTDVGENFAGFAGVPGGIVGGVPGGVIGGIVGGLPEAPPPPPPPAPRDPVRIGGHIQAPVPIKRVPPVYPPLAVRARIEGVVILEATVRRDGRVEDVQVLRSVGFLDQAAIDAVRQWEYAPLLLNGQPERFILTVEVSFSLP
jgi:protein TonB